jgi:hypothetical protein
MIIFCLIVLAVQAGALAFAVVAGNVTALFASGIGGTFACLLST